MWALHARRSLAVLPCLLAFGLPLSAQTAPQRAVAFTIDDLPAGAANSMSAPEILEMTTKLLGTLRDQKVPAVGFVNEQKLYKLGEVDERIKALNLWLDGGFELGNHTFAHTSLNRVTLQAWEEEVVRGETVTRDIGQRHLVLLAAMVYAMGAICVKRSVFLTLLVATLASSLCGVVWVRCFRESTGT